MELDKSIPLVAPSLSDLNFSPITLENYGKGPFEGIKEADAIHQLEILAAFKVSGSKLFHFRRSCF